MNLNSYISPGRHLLLPTVIIGWAVIALVSRAFVPWLYWLSMAALPAFVIFKLEQDYLKSKSGRKVLLISFGVLVIHIIWAFIRSHHYNAAVTGTYWKDDHAYYNEAVAIAEAWGHGHYPDIWRYGSLPYLGTLHTGYHRPLAALFLLFGPTTFGGLLLNAVSAALLPLLAALCARLLWLKDVNSHTAVNDWDIGVIAAVLTACHPTQFYWAAFLMKDLYLTFAFMVTLILILGAYRYKSASMGVAALFTLPYLFTIRAYTAIAECLGAFILPLSRFSRRVLFRFALALIVFLVLFCAYTIRGNDFYSQLRDSLLALTPRHLNSPTDFLVQIVAGIPRLFLSPYAWLIVDGSSGMYGMYPGMWYLYLVGYPLSFAGLYTAVKADIKPAAVPMAVFGLSALIFLGAIYQGDASRQRYYLEYIVLIFAAYGIKNPSKWWIGGILAAEAAFALGQLMSLR